LSVGKGIDINSAAGMTLTAGSSGIAVTGSAGSNGTIYTYISSSFFAPVTLNSILTLTPISTTPTGAPSGSFIVSGSGANMKPYFWNGLTWTALF
jgi:hypothetical protein